MRLRLVRRRLALLIVLSFALVFALPSTSEAAPPRLTITLTPPDSNSAVGDSIELVATVTIVDDGGSHQVAGWAVRFESSAGWTSAPVLTDGYGMARYPYARNAPGTEQIRASVVSAGCSGTVSAATTHSWWTPTLTLSPDLDTTFATPGKPFTVTARLRLGPNPLPGARFLFTASDSPLTGPVRLEATDTAGTGEVSFTWLRTGSVTDRVTVAVPARGLVATGRLLWRNVELVLDTSPSRIATVGQPFTVTATLSQGGRPVVGQDINFEARRSGGDYGRVFGSRVTLPIDEDATGSDTTDSSGRAYFTWTRPEETYEIVTADATELGVVQEGEVAWRRVVIELSPDLGDNVGRVSENFTLTATATFDGKPLPNEAIFFDARKAGENPVLVSNTSGNNPLGDKVTDAQGRAQFTWSRLNGGDDTIVIRVRSTTVTDTLTWSPVQVGLSPWPEADEETIGNEYTLTATAMINGTELPDEPISFEASKPGEDTISNAGGPSPNLPTRTDGDGQAEFTWSREEVGADDIIIRVRSTRVELTIFWIESDEGLGRIPEGGGALQRRAKVEDGAGTSGINGDRTRDRGERAPYAANSKPPIDLALAKALVSDPTGVRARLTARVIVPTDGSRPLVGWPVVFSGTGGGGWESQPVLTDPSGFARFDRRLDNSIGREQFSARLVFSPCTGIDDGPLNQDRQQPIILLDPLDAETEVGNPFTLTATLRDSALANAQPKVGAELRMTATSPGCGVVVDQSTTNAFGAATFGPRTCAVPTLENIEVIEVINNAVPARATTTHRWFRRNVVTPSPVTPSPDSPSPQTDEPTTVVEPSDPVVEESESSSPSSTGSQTPTTTPPPPPPPPPPPTGAVTGIGRPGGDLTVSGGGCEPGERAVIYLGDIAVGEGVADENGGFVVSAVIPNLPLGKYTVRSSCGVTDTFTVDITSPEAVGSQAPAAGATTAAVLLFFVLLGNAVLRWVGGDASGGGFHAG